MTMLDFLESVKNSKAEADLCQYRIDELKAQATSITAQLRSTPSGPSGDKHKDAILVALADEITKYEERLSSYMASIENVAQFINELPTAAHRAVLKCRYIELMTWVKTTHEVSKMLRRRYKERQMYNIHNAALAEAKKIWEADYADRYSKEKDK